MILCNFQGWTLLFPLLQHMLLELIHHALKSPHGEIWGVSVNCRTPNRWPAPPASHVSAPTWMFKPRWAPRWLQPWWRHVKQKNSPSWALPTHKVVAIDKRPTIFCHLVLEWSAAPWWLEHSPSGPWVSGTELSLFSSPASEGYTCNIICLNEKCFLRSVFLAENTQLKKIPEQNIIPLLPDHSTKSLYVNIMFQMRAIWN